MNRILKAVNDRVNPDRGVQLMMSSFLQAAGVQHALGVEKEQWVPGKPLKLLLAGYVGTRNTGAEVRVEEMIRQFRHILGDENLELTIMTLSRKESAGYFGGTRQIEMPKVFPKFLYDQCPKHHGVVACEGSMFKSKFASALTTMMAGALGMAATENKLSVGYGAEAGEMIPSLTHFVRKHCRDSLIICRNEPSREVLGRMGIRTKGGTDTAWTFEPAPKARGAELLRDAGWDGKTKILTVCPINPFWWPVKPDLLKATTRILSGQHEDEHYASIYFHNWSSKRARQYEHYLDGLAQAVTAFAKKRKVFPVFVGMERLDRRACEHLSTRFSTKPPLFISDCYDMYELVSILRNSSYLVSSRYHAVVTSMPGQVPSIGVTMDERIRNLMNDRGHPHLFLEVDDPDLGERLTEVLFDLARNQEKVSQEIGQSIPRRLQLMGEMGIDFMDEVERVYPEFPRRNLERRWDAYLPKLPQAITRLLEMYT